MARDISAVGSSKHGFRTDIQAMRGVAVLLVLLYHAGLPYLSAGYLGVDIFFVISGFLITGVIRKGLEAGSFSFFRFYYRRAKRLLPAAYVVIAATVLAAPFFLGELALQDLKAQVIGALTFTANFVLYGQTGYFEAGGETKALLHFWSLAIEEQYYMVMPLLLFLVPRRAWLAVVVALLVVSGAASPYLAAHYPDIAFYLPPARIWELALGSLGALLPARLIGGRLLSLARIPAILVLLIIPLFPTGLPHPGVDAYLVCLASLIIILGHDRNPAENSLPVRGLAFVGDFSYSLYLVHWPLIVFTRAAWLEEAPGYALAVAAGLSVVLAWLLYRFVEEPFRRGYDAVPARTVGGILAASLAIAIAPTVVQAATKSDVDYNRMLRRNYGLDPACASRAAAFTELPAPCLSRPAPKVLIWGDSFAMMWAQALADEFSGEGIAQATLPHCTPLYDAAVSGTRASPDRRRDNEACLDFNRSVVDYIRRNESIETVLISSPFAAPVSRAAYLLARDADGKVTQKRLTVERALDNYRQLVAALRETGKKIAVIAPPPRLRIDTAECQERRMRGLVTFGRYSDCVIPEKSWRRYRARTLDFLDKMSPAADVAVLSPSDFLCNDGRCATAIGDIIIYRDHGHLSYAGSSLIAREWGIRDLIAAGAR